MSGSIRMDIKIGIEITLTNSKIDKTELKKKINLNFKKSFFSSIFCKFLNIYNIGKFFYYFFNSFFKSSYSFIILFMKFIVSFVFSLNPLGVRT